MVFSLLSGMHLLGQEQNEQNDFFKLFLWKILIRSDQWVFGFVIFTTDSQEIVDGSNLTV